MGPCPPVRPPVEARQTRICRASGFSGPGARASWSQQLGAWAARLMLAHGAGHGCVLRALRPAVLPRSRRGTTTASATGSWCRPTPAPRWPSASGRPNGSMRTDFGRAAGLCRPGQSRAAGAGCGQPPATGRGQAGRQEVDQEERAADEGGRGRLRRFRRSTSTSWW